MDSRVWERFTAILGMPACADAASLDEVFAEVRRLKKLETSLRRAALLPWGSP